VRPLVPLAAAGLVAAGCAALQPGLTTASARLTNAQGEVVGSATLAQVSGGVRILLTARGLPAGDKGVHIHAVGTCEPPAFASAGGHVNPDGRQYGLLNPRGPHAGDLPNLRIEADGAGRLESLNDRITLGAGPTSLFDGDGSALVIHEAADDQRTDPSGNSGGRLACGVIVKPSPAAWRTTRWSAPAAGRRR
jgi:superoxide dismutase, Cu-Zn family